MKDQAIRDDDPNNSTWWLIPPIVIGIVGGVLSLASGSSTATAVTRAVLAGLVLGVAEKSLPSIRTWVSARSITRQFAVRAGAHGTVKDTDPTALGVHESDRDNSVFIRADSWSEIERALSDEKPVLVIGRPLSGKTRLAVEVLRDRWGERPLFAPTEPGLLKRFLEGPYSLADESVVLLDRVDRFLDSGLSVHDISRWRKNHVVLATIDMEVYERLQEQTNARATLEQFRRVFIAWTPSESDIAATRAIGPYRDLAEDVEAWGCGLPALIAAEPRLRDRYELGADRHDSGWALVRAAIDWRRVGLGAIDRRRLEGLASSYPDCLDRPNWAQAWTWASEEVPGGLALLMMLDVDLWRAPNVTLSFNRGSVPEEVLRAVAAGELRPGQKATTARYLRETGAVEWAQTIDSLNRQASEQAEGRAVLVMQQVEAMTSPLTGTSVPDKYPQVVHTPGEQRLEELRTLLIDPSIWKDPWQREEAEEDELYG